MRSIKRTFARVLPIVCVVMFFRLSFPEDSSSLMPEMISKSIVLFAASTLLLIFSISISEDTAFSVLLRRLTVKLKTDVPSIDPIAGTTRRTGDTVKDRELAEALLADPKENAEHVMLVDLARNDLSRNCHDVRVIVL